MIVFLTLLLEIKKKVIKTSEKLQKIVKIKRFKFVKTFFFENFYLYLINSYFLFKHLNQHFLFFIFHL